MEQDSLIDLIKGMTGSWTTRGRRQNAAWEVSQSAQKEGVDVRKEMQLSGRKQIEIHYHTRRLGLSIPPGAEADFRHGVH